jgi:hypothetical protein
VTVAEPVFVWPARIVSNPVTVTDPLVSVPLAAAVGVSSPPPMLALRL